jgi:hypothetical protein
MNIIKIENIEDLLLDVGGQKVLLDRDVASLYGVGTKEINQAVSNNPDKFLVGYIFEIDKKPKLNWSKNLTASTRSNTRLYCLKPLLRKVFVCWQQL